MNRSKKRRRKKDGVLEAERKRQQSHRDRGEAYPPDADAKRRIDRRYE